MKRLALALLLGSALVGPAAAVISSTPVGNANYTTLATDQRVTLTVAFTAPRTLTLVSAGASCIGQTCPANAFLIIDQTGVVSAINTLTIAPASGETINGSTSSIVIGEPFGVIELFPTNGSNWNIHIYAPGQYPGTTTNDNAAVGAIGEFYTGTTNTLANATPGAPTGTQSIVTSAPTLVTTSVANISQLLLSPGDWDCRGQVQLAGDGTGPAATTFSAWTSTQNQGAAPPIPSNIQTGVPSNPSFASIQAASVVSPAWSLDTAPMRFSLAAATSVYLNAVATFSAGQATGVGTLGCRRVR